MPVRADVLGSRRFQNGAAVDTPNGWGLWNDGDVSSEPGAEGDLGEDVTSPPGDLKRLFNSMATDAYDAERDLEGDTLGAFSH